MVFSDAMTKTLLGSAGLSTLSKASGASKTDVEEVLSAAIPLLMGQMEKNASTEEGAASLAKALKDHAGQDLSDPAAFLKGADAKDGAKIIKHILGEDTTKVQKSLAKSTGLKGSQISTILTLAAPLMLSMLGSQKEEEEVADNQVGSLLGSLLGGSGSGSGSLVNTLLGSSSSTNLLGSLLGSSGSQSSSSSGSGLGGMLFSSLLGALGDDPVEMEEEEDDGVDLLSMLFGGNEDEETVTTLSQEPESDGGDLLLNVLGSLLK